MYKKIESEQEIKTGVWVRNTKTNDVYQIGDFYPNHGWLINPNGKNMIHSGIVLYARIGSLLSDYEIRVDQF